MKPFFTCLLLLAAGLVYGQAFTYPAIQQKATRLEDFVPANWTLMDYATGDLNKDKLKDAAMVLEYRDSIQIVKATKDTVITQPRMLLIVFKDSTDEYYYVAEQSQSFIQNHDNPIMSDPFEGIYINKGILQIDFSFFASMGSWYMSGTSYKFRYQQGEFVLIGADKHSIHRGSLDYEEYSYNFLTKKRSLTKGNEGDSKKKTTWKTLNIPVLKTLKTLREPYTWEVEKDKFL
ncbi:MAG TPA: hypothetical protein VD993_05345 [Chitinophagaceae bacterium]|nr:hypothetical protein [Chitinophagaceae bacterium]